MDDLRLTLLITGLVILAVMALVHRKRAKKHRAQANWRIHAQEPSLGKSNHEDAFDQEGEAEGQATDSPDYRDEPVQPALKGFSPPPHEANEVITLYVRRRDEGLISGPALSDAARRAGLSFGEMNIFHRRQEGVDQPVFSLANLVAPGDFNPDDWESFKSPGVTLFAQLPGPVSALDVWDSMLATATRLTELLDAVILDANKLQLSRKRIAEMRERMRQLDRDAGIAHETD
ncbi:MAG TPA: cell division protein ZipA [Wenzhouxiangella sp.]